MTIELYFSQHFGVSPTVLEDYGAFDISLASDLPLFIDPFLLFNSKKQDYRDLHDGMIRYLVFLRDRATPDLDPGLIKSWYMFQEVKQNWLGFTVLGNSGSGLGKDFARALHSSLGSILKGFGSESITKGAHLEKLALIKDGVGRDNISDFTTNLIKGYLLEYTQEFAQAHLSPDQLGTFSVARAVFNYETETGKRASTTCPRSAATTSCSPQPTCLPRTTPGSVALTWCASSAASPTRSRMTSSVRRSTTTSSRS